MPPSQPPGPKNPEKFYLYYGHRNRNPKQHRPTVLGGLFSNRQSLSPPKPPLKKPLSRHPQPFDLQKWDPHLLSSSQPSKRITPSETFFSTSLRLSPIARFILDAFRKNQNQWGPPVIDELNKLRRVTPNLVVEVLKAFHITHNSSPTIASKFFHWAGKQKGFHHNFASYNSFAYCLNRHNRFRAADQVPELMASQGKPPSEKQFEILIRMHSDANRGLRVYYVYEKMKKFGVKPRVFLYNRIIDALVKTNHLDLALSVYQDFLDDGLVEETVTFMILIKGLCKAGRIDEMLKILGKMRANLCKPDVFAYTAMVKLMVSQGNLDGSLRVWEEMREDGVVPDVMAYGTLVMGLCEAGRIKKGYELFREMKKKGILIDRSIYGSLIEAFVRNGKVGSACDLLKDLVDSGYRADLGMYNSLIRGLCNVKRVDKAYKLFQVAVQEDLNPDFETLNPILVAYAEKGEIEDFCKLLSQMQKFGFCVNDDLSKFFSFMAGKEDRIMTVAKVFEELKVKDYCSVAIYNIIMEALYKNGDFKKALLLFDEMKGIPKLVADSSTYSIAILCFVQVGEIQKACTCHNKIIELSCVPSVAAYCALANGLCKIGEIDATLMLVRDCLANVDSGPMEFKYALTILHACKSGFAEKVIEVLEEMMEIGCRPDGVTYSAIISGMCKYGTIEEARKIFSNMKGQKLLTEANEIMYDDLLIEHMKKKTADLVRSGLKFFHLESKLKTKGCTLLST